MPDCHRLTHHPSRPFKQRSYQEICPANNSTVQKLCCKTVFSIGLSKCCTPLPHTHGHPGRRKSQPSFGTTSTSWTLKPEAWHLLIRSRVWIAAAPTFLLKRSLPPSPNILINFPIIGTTLSAATVAFFNCDSLACRKSESCLALHQSPNILNPFNDLTLIDLKPTYERRSQPLVNCKEIKGWVSFFSCGPYRSWDLC